MTIIWTGIVLLLVALLGRRWLSERRVAFSNRQGLAARKLRLRLVAPGRLRGGRAGLAIRVRHLKDPHEPDQQTEVEAMVPSQVPVRFHVVTRTEDTPPDSSFDDKVSVPSLDHNFLVRGDGADKVNQILGDANVTRLMMSITDENAILDLDGRHVRIRYPGDITKLNDIHLDRAVAIAIALARAWHGPWQSWAKSRNWVVNDHGRRIVGRFHGTQVDVREVTNRKGEIFTRITADIVGGMPGGARIQHIDLAPPDTQPFRPDTPDVHATANVPEAMQRILRDPDVMAAVRWLVCDHVGSRIGERQARLLMPGKVVELGSPVSRLVGIVQALTDAQTEPQEAELVRS